MLVVKLNVEMMKKLDYKLGVKFFPGMVSVSVNMLKVQMML